MNSTERPVATLPRWVLLALTVSLFAQIAWKGQLRPGPLPAEDLPRPIGQKALKIAALGEPETLARLAMLYLQAFDYHGSNSLPYRKLDYGRLTGWLRDIESLDPKSQYPLFISSRVYAEIPDATRQRIMLEFIYSEYFLDPNRRWPWLAHAALVAKHQLKDPQLALKYARAVDRFTTVKDIPLWAKQMEVFILEDLNELDAARIMLGGMLENGQIHDPGERRFLEERLKEMESKREGKSRP